MVVVDRLKYNGSNLRPRAVTTNARGVGVGITRPEMALDKSTLDPNAFLKHSTLAVTFSYLLLLSVITLGSTS